MGAITWNMLPTLLHPGGRSRAATFTGTPDQARMILGLFLLVIAFGALGTVNALYMIATGRQNRVVRRSSRLLLAVASSIGFAWLDRPSGVK